MVEDTCNPSILEAEASVLLSQDQCGPRIKTLSQKPKQKANMKFILCLA